MRNLFTLLSIAIISSLLAIAIISSAMATTFHGQSLKTAPDSVVAKCDRGDCGGGGG
jgi:hypothetical protein